MTTGDNYSIKKTVIFKDKIDGSAREIVASVSLPEYSNDERGSYACYVHIDELFPVKRKLYGADPFQAVIIAIRFIDQLMIANRAHCEVLEKSGEQYIAHTVSK